MTRINAVIPQRPTKTREENFPLFLSPVLFLSPLQKTEKWFQKMY
jgi:hypothetical protein